MNLTSIKLLQTTILVLVLSLSFSISYAASPKFKFHILKNLAPGFNYSLNSPIVLDYDSDGDFDILIINKEGVMYFLENLQIP